VPIAQVPGVCALLSDRIGVTLPADKSGYDSVSPGEDAPGQNHNGPERYPIVFFVIQWADISNPTIGTFPSTMIATVFLDVVVSSGGLSSVPVPGVLVKGRENNA